MTPNARCYFGCSDRLNRTLLDLPGYSSPRLCEYHSEQWAIYRACLIVQSNTIEWPDDFWPFERKMREEMEKDSTEAGARDVRPPGTEIQASDAIVGSWYEIPSGEVERCHAIRNRGRGVQVGFVGILDTGSDPDEIRWLQGKTQICVVDEIEVAKLARALCKDGEIKPSSVADGFPLEFCPRNGLLCSVCEFPQRETPNGATCENGHGGAPGMHARDVANALGADGHVQEAQIVLGLVPPSARVGVVEGEAHIGGSALTFGESDVEPQAGGSGLTLREIAQAYPQYSDLAGLADREAGALIVERTPLSVEGEAAIYAKESYLPPRPFVLPVYHKSLHIDWRTPKDLFDSQVRRWGPFWLDAAATAENKLCEYHLGPGAEIEDALTVGWLPTPEIVTAYGKNVWLNHPYSKSEKKCTEGCSKPKCAERGYHLERDIASSGEWLIYARDQVLLKGAPRVVCLTKAAVETGWWRDAVRIQPKEAGMFLSGECDPMGGPAAKFMDSEYPAATWFEFRWENLIVDVVEIEGRADFDRGGNDGSAGFPSAIVTFHKPGE